MLSIIISHYNGELSNLLDLLSQLDHELPNWPISCEILVILQSQKFQRKRAEFSVLVETSFARVKFLQVENVTTEGLLYNEGAKEAKGQYLLFLDSNCVFPTSSITKGKFSETSSFFTLVQILQNNPTIGAVGCSIVKGFEVTPWLPDVIPYLNNRMLLLNLLVSFPALFLLMEQLLLFLISLLEGLVLMIKELMSLIFITLALIIVSRQKI